MTGINHNTLKSELTLHRRNIVINALNPPRTYHPGKLITYKVMGQKFDGSPIKDYENLVILSINGLNFYSNFNENGLATFFFTLPVFEGSAKVICRYFGISKYFYDIFPIVPNILPPERFQLNLKTER